MWSGPRNISTALMRSWENREDTEVWDEPLYAYYLSQTGIVHPGRDEIIAAGQTDWKEVTTYCGQGPQNTDVFFQKHMAHHLLPEVDRNWLSQVHNCFLIRDPREVVNSYARVREQPNLMDLGFVEQRQIFDDVQGMTGSTPIVIDSRDVLENPRSILKQMCESLDLEFSERMLDWPAGPRPSDGAWAPYWYASVEVSTGFSPYVERNIQLPAHLEALAESGMEHYQSLYTHRIRP
jgi:hypothetical protein